MERRPGSYVVCMLLIVAVAAACEVAGSVLVPALSGGQLSGLHATLLGIGGAAVLALLILNGRWLWLTLGSLRFALAIITVWAVASVLGTLVVQRFPYQNDAGYAKTFKEATAEFLYSAVHLGSSVVVHPAPDVQRWFEDQRHLFGEREAKETEKQWRASETGRLRAAAIDAFHDEHETLLERTLAIVSAARLPEAFQISIWFKALLGMLSLALVIVVMQRWRGEWRQVGWVMAHFGMVIFIVGATVRATTKVDGFMTMHVGKTSDWYGRNAIGRQEPTPLGFDFTLNRFKTEYPKQLGLMLMGQHGEEPVSKTFRVEPGWTCELLDGRLQLRVDRWVENAAARLAHGEDESGGPTALVRLEGPWLDEPAEIPLRSEFSMPLRPPDGGYHLQYRRAAPSEFDGLAQVATPEGRIGRLYTHTGELLGDVVPGARWELPEEGLELQLAASWPDYAQRGHPDGAEAEPSDPALQLEVFRGSERLGEAWVFEDGMEPEPGLELPVGLRYEFDWWAAPAPIHYRLIEAPGRPLALVAFREGQAPELREVTADEPLELGAAGDRLTWLRSFDRYVPRLQVGPADTTGMTPDDVYYASLPTAIELTLHTPEPAQAAPVEAGLQASIVPADDALRDFTRSLAELLAHEEPPRSSGIVREADFDRGEGQLTATADGRGLRVRLLSDDPDLAVFPDRKLVEALRQRDGAMLPIQVSWFTNEEGAPLRFTSDVSLSKDGKLLKRALVEPNKPIYLAGWQFSQADFRKDEPDYSGFGVVRDPSVRVVYAGMFILVLGVILLFYVYPLVAGRRAARSTR